MNGGAGEDTLFDGGGSNTFVFDKESIGSGVDKIKDFNRSKDKLDISDLLTEYNPADDALGDFVKVTRSGLKTVLSVDTDGGGQGAEFTTIAVIQGGGRMDLQDLVNGGNLLVT